MSRFLALVAGGLLATAALVATPAMAMQAYPANVYFHFTDAKGDDFRIPQAVPGLTVCDQAKLAVLAKTLQKRDSFYAGWTYVRAECRAPRR